MASSRDSFHLNNSTMSLRFLLIAFAAAIALAGCGGGDPEAERFAIQSGSHASVVQGPQVFAGSRAGYAITRTADGWTVTELGNGAGAGAGVAVGRNARLRFADGSLALDTEGAAAQVYRLYQAAFARTPDAAGIGYWIDAMDRGAAPMSIAHEFVRSAEYRTVYGDNPGNLLVVERYYQNVLGRAGETAGINYWKGVLDSGAATPASVLLGFSDSAENEAMVLAAVRNGITYLEPGVIYAPTANPGRTRIANAGSVVGLDGTLSTGSPGRTLTYAWTLAARPAGSAATLVQATSARPAFVADVGGTYEVTLSVSDGFATSAVSRVTIIALWQPAGGAMPASGNAVYLESDPGDYIGGGQRRVFTSADSLFTLTASGASLRLRLTGDQDWDGEFVGMNTLARLERGYYGDLSRFPFHNPVKGGLSWSGEGRGCNTLSGWFVIDSISYEGAQLTAIDLRFAQHCEGGSAALRGRIRWSASDTAVLPGPAIPPAGLWQPAPEALPASGNYVHLQSTGGDYIGSGGTYTYTGANAILAVNTAGAGANVRVDGDQEWSGDFAPMSSVGRLEKGYYGNLQRYPFHNPVKGGLSWSGEGRGCNTLSGWFVVDHAAYDGNRLTALDLRFEQRCEGGSSALRGKIHWSEGETGSVPGPVRPAPAGLWQPAPNAVPASGNYIYLQSMLGDYIGGGATRVFTDTNAILNVSGSGAMLRVNVNGDSSWSGEFAGMNALAQLEPGYYGGLQRYPFHNPVKGGLSWSGDGRGCNTLAGWFVVDKVSYVMGKLTEVDLRFEQRCEGGAAALRGKLHWNANNAGTPPGPIQSRS